MIPEETFSHPSVTVLLSQLHGLDRYLIFSLIIMDTVVPMSFICLLMEVVLVASIANVTEQIILDQAAFANPVYFSPTCAKS